MQIPEAIKAIRSTTGLTQERLAQLLGVSFVTVNRWERGAGDPSPAQAQKILKFAGELSSSAKGVLGENGQAVFASRGVRSRRSPLPLFDSSELISLSNDPLDPVLQRISSGRCFSGEERELIDQLLAEHSAKARVSPAPPMAGMSAGKNTYTYDAHTYHTKVPPQGIAELLKHYLPEGGLVLDPFAGSGMTGVAAAANGYDCLLNELSPAACFIASRFTKFVQPEKFDAALRTVLRELAWVREALYVTHCRECGKRAELLYTVWSYRVQCNFCHSDFVLWDHCRRYGRRVKEHKILTEFNCPECRRTLKKSRLRRSVAVPVQIAYKCCGSRQQEVTHSPDEFDLSLIYSCEMAPPVADGFYPQTPLPDGVNLCQPKRHGLDRVDRFYTPRNLAAMSQIWRLIHRVEDTEMAGHLAFVFTSLYQRVTRLSEFRFWGGSGNTAHFNVPYIFDEPNVLRTFERKARSIQDHLETTAASYSGRVVVVQNTATSLDYLPDGCVDLIFTDPPFGANINYSEMNILWESWLGRYTDNTYEAVVNRVQRKGVNEYQHLLTLSLQECYRVLRRGSWMLLVFMNTNAEVWRAIRLAISSAGFDIRSADIFDKQHGTFKQFVSENAAGFDIVFHCLKPMTNAPSQPVILSGSVEQSIFAFLETVDISSRVATYLHVDRRSELDVRKLYSEWLISQSPVGLMPAVDFSIFRSLVERWLAQRQGIT